MATGGASDLKLSVQDYCKQQAQHTALVAAQRHSMMHKQLVAKLSGAIESVQRQAKQARDVVASFKADPSCGASKVRPSVIACSFLDQWARTDSTL